MFKIRVSGTVAIVVQMIAVWILGSVIVPIVFAGVFVLAFDVTSGQVVALAVAGMAVCYGYLVVVVTVTRDVSRLGARGFGRAGWAAIVLGVGSAGWILGFRVIVDMGLGGGRALLLILLLGGVPFALGARLLLRTGSPTVPRSPRS